MAAVFVMSNVLCFVCLFLGGILLFDYDRDYYKDFVPFVIEAAKPSAVVVTKYEPYWVIYVQF